MRLAVVLVVLALFGALDAPLAPMFAHPETVGADVARVPSAPGSSWMLSGWGIPGTIGKALARKKKPSAAKLAQKQKEEEKKAKALEKARQKLKSNKEKQKAEELPRKQVRYSPLAGAGKWAADQIAQETVLGDDDLSWRWSKRSFEACEYVFAGKGLLVDPPSQSEETTKRPAPGSWVPKGYCHEFQDIVEDVFDIEGHNMVDIVGYWDLDTILGHAEQEHFKMVGYQVLMDVLNWMCEHKIKRSDDIRKAYQSKWIGWMLKIVTGDTQNLHNLPPGYDPVKARTAKEREEWDPNYDPEQALKERNGKMMREELGF